MAYDSGGNPHRRPAGLPRGAQVLLLVAAALVLVLLLVVLPARLRAMAAKPEAAPQAQPAGGFRPTADQWRALSFTRVEPRSFAALISTDGKIAEDDDVTVQITPPFSGRVVAVAVRQGDRVAKGQTLLTAEASEIAQANNDLATAQANLKTAQAQLQVAAANATRQQALFAIDGAAQRDVQQAQSDLATAQGAVRTADAALAAVRSRVNILDVGAPNATGGDALATLRAPIAGVVTQRQVGPGQFLNATANGSTTPIFTVSDLSKVWLTANVREEDAARMRIGLPIRVKVMGLPGQAFDAAVSYVAPTLDPVTRRLPVRAVVANPGERLKPEMFADFAIRDGTDNEALGVPAAAVIYEGDTARVWVARPDRTLALRQVKAGRSSGGEVEILQGLSAGDQVVTSGAIFIDRAAKSD